jgi:hypothetical protein
LAAFLLLTLTNNVLCYKIKTHYFTLIIIIVLTMFVRLPFEYTWVGTYIKVLQINMTCHFTAQGNPSVTQMVSWYLDKFIIWVQCNVMAKNNILILISTIFISIVYFKILLM